MDPGTASGTALLCASLCTLKTCRPRRLRSRCAQDWAALYDEGDASRAVLEGVCSSHTLFRRGAWPA